MSFKKRHTIDPSENQNGNRTVEDQIRRVSIADNGSYQFQYGKNQLQPQQQRTSLPEKSMGKNQEGLVDDKGKNGSNKKQNKDGNSKNINQEKGKQESNKDGSKNISKKKQKFTYQVATPLLVEARKGIDELGLQFDNTDKQDISILAVTLAYYLQYPSTALAKSHARANKLGEFDVLTAEQYQRIRKQSSYQNFRQFQKQKKNNQKNLDKRLQESVQYTNRIKGLQVRHDVKPKRCKCCGLPQQEKQIKICQKLEQVTHIGIAINLYFRTIINICILLLIMSAVFSGYSIASNISCYELINSYKGSTDFINNTNQFSEQFNKILDTAATFDQAAMSGSFSSIIGSDLIDRKSLIQNANSFMFQLQKSSFSSKFYLQGFQAEHPSLTFTIQSWLGFVTIILWMIALTWLQYYDNKYQQMIKKLITSAGSFTLLFKNVPKYYYGRKQKQKDFQKMIKFYLYSNIKFIEGNEKLKNFTKQINFQINKKQTYNQIFKYLLQNQQTNSQIQNHDINQHDETNKNLQEKPSLQKFQQQKSQISEQKRSTRKLVQNYFEIEDDQQRKYLVHLMQQQMFQVIKNHYNSCNQDIFKPQIYKVNFITFYDNQELNNIQNDFGDEKLKQINKQITQCRQKFVDIIQYRMKNDQFFDKLQMTDSGIFRRYDDLKKLRKHYHDKLRNEKKYEFYQQVMKEGRFEGLSCFVTFESLAMKTLIQKLHQKQQSWFQNPVVERKKYLHFPTDHGQVQITVELAPQPEDIIWSSYSKTGAEARCYKILTNISIVLLLGLSFFSTYKLTQIQIQKQQKRQVDDKVAFYMGLVTTFINTNIATIIKKLTKFQANTTKTQEQTSIAIKTIMSQCLNGIIMPISMCVIFKKNMYGIGGLADSIFYQTVTSVVLNPLLKILNPNIAFMKIRKQLSKIPAQKLKLTQQQLNAKFEQNDFQIGYQYVNLIYMYIFACFFAVLQPSIVPLTALGMIIYYWTQKLRLFRLSKRPVPGTDYIYDRMFKIIKLGPLFYTIGAFLWGSDIITVSPIQSKIPNFVALVASISFIFISFDKIVQKIFKQQKSVRSANYSQQRIFLTSQYQGLNPDSAKGYKKNYYEFQIQKLIQFAQSVKIKQENNVILSKLDQQISEFNIQIKQNRSKHKKQIQKKVLQKALNQEKKLYNIIQQIKHYEVQMKQKQSSYLSKLQDKQRFESLVNLKQKISPIFRELVEKITDTQERMIAQCTFTSSTDELYEQGQQQNKCPYYDIKMNYQYLEKQSIQLQRIFEKIRQKDEIAYEQIKKSKNKNKKANMTQQHSDKPSDIPIIQSLKNPADKLQSKPTDKITNQSTKNITNQAQDIQNKKVRKIKDYLYNKLQNCKYTEIRMSIGDFGNSDLQICRIFPQKKRFKKDQVYDFDINKQNQLILQQEGWIDQELKKVNNQIQQKYISLDSKQGQIKNKINQKLEKQINDRIMKMKEDQKQKKIFKKQLEQRQIQQKERNKTKIKQQNISNQKLQENKNKNQYKDSKQSEKRRNQNIKLEPLPPIESSPKKQKKKNEQKQQKQQSTTIPKKLQQFSPIQPKIKVKQVEYQQIKQHQHQHQQQQPQNTQTTPKQQQQQLSHPQAPFKNIQKQITKNKNKNQVAEQNSNKKNKNKWDNIARLTQQNKLKKNQEKIDD